jgi:hypothetical protein
MPSLASVSAQMQGKPLVEICSVYGVSQLPLAGDDHEPAPQHASDHGGEHCALTALTALATAEQSPHAPAAVALRDAETLRAHAPSQAPDACAVWVARLKHGPPAST